MGAPPTDDAKPILHQSSSDSGSPPAQLPAVNQSEEIVPVQLVCARVDVAAASNAAATAVVANKCVRIAPSPLCDNTLDATDATTQRTRASRFNGDGLFAAIAGDRADREKGGRALGGGYGLSCRDAGLVAEK
jgi:hypothetical protein